MGRHVPRSIYGGELDFEAGAGEPRVGAKPFANERVNLVLLVV